MDIELKQLDIKEEYEPEIGSTELVFETVSLPSKFNQTKSIAIWSNEETKKLIELYKKFMVDIGPYNRFRRKKDMWIEISSHFPNMSAKQCEERLKTILRRKRKGIIEKASLTEGKRELLDIQQDEENELDIIRNQKIHLEVDEIITANRGIPVWSASETKLLVGLYKSFINEVGPQKKFRHKKDMWAQIALNLENKDRSQCEQRFNALFKRKKKSPTKSYAIKARRKTLDCRPRHLVETSPSKNSKINVEAEDIVDDDIVQAREKYENAEQPNNNTPANADNREIFSITETLLKIAAKKEEEKERRHRERMEAMANFQNILLQVLNASKN